MESQKFSQTQYKIVYGILFPSLNIFFIHPFYSKFEMKLNQNRSQN